jgi:hypothetical protein
MQVTHVTQGERQGLCEECGTRLYQAGEWAPAGTYLRVDDGSLRSLSLAADGALPASFDGRVALYRAAAAPCVCERHTYRHTYKAGADDHTSEEVAGAAM